MNKPGKTEESRIRVLLVDDSLTFRKQMAHVFEKADDIFVAGEAENGKEAIEQAMALDPDVILMDIVMPVMSGLAAVEYIMTHIPAPIVIQSHFLSRAEFDKTRDARMAGALTALDKSDADRDHAGWERNLIRTVRAASRIKVAQCQDPVTIRDRTPPARPPEFPKDAGGKNGHPDDGIRVLVVDDSLTVRKTVMEVLGKEWDITVVGEAKDGAEAIEETKRLDPDVILMDIVMPVMSGLAAVEYIMAHMPRSIVIHSSFANRGESHRTWDAEMAGALAALDKSVSEKDPGRWERDLIRTVRAASRVKPAPLGKQRALPEGTKELPAKIADYNLVAFGVSLGGPAVIAKILTSLPPGFPLPVLLVIHSSASERSFSEWLNDNCGLRVKVASDGEPITQRPGRVFVSPTGTHMTVKRGRIRLMDSPPVNFCRPSIDVLFHSLAQGREIKPVGVLLTGMGKDGADGLKAIKNSGGYTICQDESTSIVFGMPKAAIDLDAADIVLPDTQIAGEILSLTKNSLKRTES